MHCVESEVWFLYTTAELVISIILLVAWILLQMGPMLTDVVVSDYQSTLHYSKWMPLTWKAIIRRGLNPSGGYIFKAMQSEQKLDSWYICVKDISHWDIEYGQRNNFVFIKEHYQAPGISITAPVSSSGEEPVDQLPTQVKISQRWELRNTNKDPMWVYVKIFP